jgi:hypothetical protein
MRISTLIDPAAEEAGDGADEHAEGGTDDDHRHARQQRDARAGHDQGEHVLPQLIGAEPIGGGRRLQPRAGIHQPGDMLRVGCQMLAANGEHQQHQHDQQAENGNPGLAETVEATPPGFDARMCGGGAHW